MKPAKNSIFYLSNLTAIAITAQLPMNTTTTDRDYDDYGPYNFFTVKNNSGQTVKVVLDGNINRSYSIASGETITTEADDNLFFKGLSIYNVGPGAVAIGEIVATIVRKISYEEARTW